MQAKKGLEKLSPMLMAVLANRFDGVVREMTNTMLRTGRSTVINSGRDFSCGITTSDNRLFATAEGLPVHTYGLDLQTKAMCQYHQNINEGDAFLHNDPYSGCSHPADHTIIVPVFWQGEHLFNVCAKAHQADIGNSIPSTYHVMARDVYEEGSLIFPAVKIESKGELNEDIIRMCQRRIRVPEMWHGDFLAMLGSARTGEKGIHSILQKYSPTVIKQFVSEWFDYSERKMREAIKKLPKATIERESFHDPMPPILPNGIPVRVKLDIKPEVGEIEIDLTMNIDNMDNGLNMSEATSISTALAGTYNCLSSDIPRNDGSYRCVKIKMREGAAIGKPKFPHSCSVATTNIADRLVNNVQAAFAELGKGYGLAEGGLGMGVGFCIISGKDKRHNNSDYVNQLIIGQNGGPASPESDGWLTYGLPVVGGVMYRDSIEIDELHYPLHFKEIRLSQDDSGAGEYRGAPGALITLGPSENPMTVVFGSDGMTNPPRGVQGGGDGNVNEMYLIQVDGTKESIPNVGQIELLKGMWISGRESSGGGYGDPFCREPEKVLSDVVEKYVSIASARTSYGVAFVGSLEDDTLSVDYATTTVLRKN
jgi:N-methylhydantoinase B